MTNWLTLTEAVQYVKASDQREIRAAIDRGDLAASRYGNRIRIDSAEIDAWLRSQPWEPKP